MNSDAGPGGRVLLAAGTKTYRHCADFAEPLATLEQVPDALRLVVEALSGFGYQSALTGTRKYLLNPRLRQLREAVRAAAGAAPVVVVYYTGHGLKPERSPYYLLTADATPVLGDTALEARQLLDLVVRRDAYGDLVPEDEQPQVLLILDCCFSGAGGIEALKESLQGIGNPKVWVLASASSVDYAQQGRFAAALSQALLQPEAGPSQELLGLDWLSEKINATLGNTGQKARYFPPGGESTGLAPFFPNPTYQPKVAGLTIAEQHWVTRLRGAQAGSSTTGFYVTGRTGRFQVVEDLARWMRDPGRGGLAVVTGSPGSGKSAMLALPVLLAGGQTREATAAGAVPGSLLTRAADLFDGLPVLGVHARGVNPYQVAGTIAAHLDRLADSPDELLADLDDRPETSRRIIVIDAVDEARDPVRLLTDLLLPLARRPAFRIVLGARRHVLAGVDDADLVIDLNTDKYRDPQALAGYAYQLLIAAREPDAASAYRDCDDSTAVTVAAAIAGKASTQLTTTGQAESFLLAQLLARAVRGRSDVLDVTRDGWSDQLPAGVGAAFDEDLRCLLGEREPAARALLSALAWARGPGLPWDRIWVPVTRRLGAGTGASNLDRDDVRWLLDNAGAYIVEDVGPGQRSVFRLLHDLVANHLRDQPSDEQIAADPVTRDAWRQRRQQVEKDITRALIESVPATSDGKPEWELAHPYLRTYLAQHALAAGPGTFAELAADLDYLAVADATTLTPQLSPTEPSLRVAARTYRRARPLLGPNLQANAAYLQEAVTIETGVRPTGQRIQPLYRTLMTRTRRDDSLLTIPVPRGASAVVFCSDATGRTLLASAGIDGTVRLWDPATGDQVGGPLGSHSDSVKSIAFGTGAEGKSLLATGGSGRGASDYSVLATGATVRLWDPVAGKQVGAPLTGYRGGVESVAFGTGAEGTPLLAIGNGDGTIQLWDLSAIQSVAEGVPCDTGPVFATFEARAAGSRLMAIGGKNGAIILMDPANLEQLQPPLVPRSVGSPRWSLTNSVVALAFETADDRLPLLAAAYEDQTVQVWDPSTGQQVGEPFRGHNGNITGLTWGRRGDGEPLLATSSTDNTVRIWAPGTARLAGRPLLGHPVSVWSVAFGTLNNGQPVLASGDGNSLRLWEADPELSDPAAPDQFQSVVGDVAFGIGSEGQLLLAVGSVDGTVRLWDVLTSAPVGPPMRAHDGGQVHVAFGADANGRALLAAGGSGGKVRLWDPATGEPVGKTLDGYTDIYAIAFGAAPDGQPVLVTGGSGGTVRLRNPLTGEEKAETAISHQDVSTLALGADGNGRSLLATASFDHVVRLWDLGTGQQIGEDLTSGETGYVRLAFHMSGNRPLLAFSDAGGTVRLWDVLNAEQFGDSLPGHVGGVTDVAFCTGSNGQVLLASADNHSTVRLWNIRTGALMAALLRRSGPRAITATDHRLAIADWEGVTVLEFAPNDL